MEYDTAHSAPRYRCADSREPIDMIPAISNHPVPEAVALRDAALEEAAKVAELQIEIEPNLTASERGLCRAIAGNIRALQSAGRKTAGE